MSESRFDRGAWLVLILVLGLSAWSVFGLVYLFSLPTDGWLTKTPDQYGVGGYIYEQNLVGAPSGLQAGDHVTAIEGVSLPQETLFELAPAWQVDNTVRYTVERNGTQLEVQVPLVNWQLVPAMTYDIQQLGGGSVIGMIAFFAIAALAFYKRPADHAARTLFLFAALFPTIGGYIQSGISMPPTSIFAVSAVLGIATIVISYTVLFPPILLHFALVFPHLKPVVQAHPRLEYVPYLIGGAVVPLFVLTNGLAGYAWTILSIVGTIALLTHSAFTMRDALSRAQLLWGLWGFILGMSMFLSTYLVLFGIVSGVAADVINVITSFSFSVLGITLGVAVLRYRLFDISVIIRRTLTYAIVAALLAVVYFGSVILLQQIFSAVSGQRSEVITVLSTLVIAALFVPLRNRVQGEIDRRFNRKKYDATRVLSTFAATVRDETDLENLTGSLLGVVKETMQPRSVSLWLKRPDEKVTRG